MKTLLAVIIGALAFQTQAAITIDASRVIYSGKDKSASLKINNRSSKNYIVQTWLDTGPETPSSGLPIVATPPLVKLRPEQSATSCALFTQEPVFLPTGKVCFWVNIQGGPSCA
ncbi:fimbria/pilus periplasmic chaperone [Klebsiella pneumoniae subsp. pneumoniae]|nr:fimbria/pilus periplasmic chaperone [Klebsiella pneumoniae subsp. pneumoniae]